MRAYALAGLLAAIVAGPANANEATGTEDVPARGIAVQSVYTGDLLGNVSGGLRRGARYLDTLDLTLALDGERLAGWEGVSVFVHGAYTNTESFSDDLVGDQQGVSNLEADADTVDLYEAWIEFGNGRASVRAGMYDLASEFDAIETADLLLNASHGTGPDFSQSGHDGPSVSTTALALRVSYAIAHDWTARLAVLDGAPGQADRPDRPSLELSEEEGALVAAELGYERDGFRSAIGYWRYTAEHEAMLSTALAGVPVTARGNDGIYGYVEGSLTSDWAGWLRVGFADKRFNPVARYVGAGIRIDAIGGRQGDAFGVGVAWAEYGDQHRMAREHEGEQGGRAELALELTYRAELNERIAVQPNLQYIIDPGGDGTIDDALVLGLRLEALLLSQAP